MSQKVFLMLSGGVDSSVSALVLKNQGYQVIGVYMKCWSRDQLLALKLSDDYYNCNWEDDYLDAQLVAKKLQIEFEMWDLQNEYRQTVVQYMLLEYQNGKTPNPDVMCNSAIKFGIFYDKAVSLGADFVATGHYCRKVEFDNQFLLAKSKFLAKDQSYFLWKINTQRLNNCLFPIGEFESKGQVRLLATKNGLITANKKDSQGLCFIGKTPLRQLLLEILGKKEGQILDSNGKVLGTHEGAFLYTLGQREGLKLSGGPWFVYRTDIALNKVWVCKKDQYEQKLQTKEIWIQDLNLFLSKEKIQNLELNVQARYHQEPVEAKIEFLSQNKAKILLKQPIYGATSGQSLVIYNQDLLVGGGII